jgi:hypothetical protein
MKKSETLEMNELSVKVFGKPHAWRKLTSKGIIVGRDKNPPYIHRRVQLSESQAKDYMIKTLEMRDAVIKEMEEQKNAE